MHPSLPLGLAVPVYCIRHSARVARDWLPALLHCSTVPQDRINRGAMLLVLEADFLEAAVRAVVAIVDGHIQALNPGDDPAFHVFVFNDMFFTRTFDYRERVKQARKRRASKAVGAWRVLRSAAVPRMNMFYMYTQHTHGHASYQLRAAPIPCLAMLLLHSPLTSLHVLYGL